MPSALPVGDIRAALAQRRFPSIVRWNRLEPRPRTQSFERALRAEVRDALWMLTRQWQMGEFRGCDAGSPVLAKLALEGSMLAKFQPGAGAARVFSGDRPLEAQVEARPVAWTQGGAAMALDLRLVLGRQWLAMIADIGAYRDAFIAAYPLVVPQPSSQNAPIAAHREAWQSYAAVAGRAMDGGALYLHLVENPAHHAYDGVSGVDPTDHDPLDTAAVRFVAWVRRVFCQPATSVDDAWSPQRLEYAFAASAPQGGGGETVYVAREYSAGKLDWYSVDVDGAATALPVSGEASANLPGTLVQTVIPSPVSFAGMPNTRWWAFEDGRTNLGDVDASTTDVAKLLLLEFALVYANDWFSMPLTLPAGTLASVRGLAVTNTFGERFWIEPATAGDDPTQRWSLFASTRVDAPAERPRSTLLLLPTAPKIQDGPALEEVLLVRDEVADMVWGVETLVPLPNGLSRRGSEVARETLAFFRAALVTPTAQPDAPSPSAAIRYRVMTTVPEHWIPFIPVHVDGSNREIQLQRAGVLRTLEGDPQPPVKVRPRTALMREGLDRHPPQPYFLHEEEVPRTGVRLVQSFQRTRWRDGRVVTWLRVRKQIGRGEATSGLAFDQVVAAGRVDG